MDINLTVQFLGMPLNLIGQISDPPIWNNAVFAAALSAFLVSIANLYLNRRQNNQETKRKQSQIVSQLEGRKSEILDLFMILIQTSLNYKYIEIQRSLFAPNSPEESRVINEEYFRLRQIGDSLIVDVAKSSGRLNETLSMVQYIFPNMMKVNERIRNIAQMQQHLKIVMDMRLDHLATESRSRMIPLIGEKLEAQLFDNWQEELVTRESEELFNWIIMNIIAPIDDISRDSGREIVVIKDITLSRYNDPIYNEINADAA